jgi:hypothetical protein
MANPPVSHVLRVQRDEVWIVPYGKTTVLGTTLIALPATGFSVASWLIGAVTLILVGVALLQLARPGASIRP